MPATSATKVYPRSILKRIVKAHSNCNVSKNADVLIYLDYVLFLEELMREAGIESKSSGDKNITARNVKRATRTALAKFRG